MYHIITDFEPKKAKKKFKTDPNTLWAIQIIKKGVRVSVTRGSEVLEEMLTKTK